jgi:pyridoxine/pyridoxamine 5'-phosphate oxidase
MPADGHVVIDDTPYNLDGLQGLAWDLLKQGSERGKEAFHTGVFATQGADGPEMRTVVLRRVDAEHRLLAFHTDARADKTVHIAANPQVAWIFYDPKRRLQLRIKGMASVHTVDALAEAQWQRSGFGSRRCYFAQSKPGLVQLRPHSNLPEFVEDNRYTMTDTEQARPNFAVVITRVVSLEVLHLHHVCHQRARIDYQPHGVEMAWLTP